MKKSKMIEKLLTALAYLDDNSGISLNEDTFLCGYLDGSDKVYGFKRLEDEILVVTREANDGFPVRDMEKEDLNYMFRSSKIYENILNKFYKECPLDSNGDLQDYEEYLEKTMDKCRDEKF